MLETPRTAAQSPSHQLNYAANVPAGKKLFSFVGKGITSKQQIKVEARPAEKGAGITFFVPDPKNENVYVEIPAHTQYVVNTLRNVVLGNNGVRLCIVEHFLAAMALWGLEDLNVIVQGPEMPLGDGSASFWIDLLKDSGVPRATSFKGIDIPRPITVTKGDRSIIVVPDTSFSVTYLMDWDHPMIGKRWFTWSSGLPVEEVADARTFGSLRDHEMLGLTEEVVSMTPEGFTHPLRFEDEPVRHKVLDIIGDLALVGVNPLRLNAKIFSIKGGHEMDVQVAKLIAQAIQL